MELEITVPYFPSMVQLIAPQIADVLLTAATEVMSGAFEPISHTHKAQRCTIVQIDFPLHVADMETIQVTLLKEKGFHVFKYMLIVLYIVYGLVYYWVREDTVAEFFAEPIEDQVLKYTSDELEYFKSFEIPVPELRHTAANILERWPYTDFYDGIKLLVLIPVTLHLAYLLVIHWSDSFKAKALYETTEDPDQAFYAKLVIQSKIGNTQRTILAKVYHSIYKMQKHEKIEFEGEKYVIAENKNGFTLVSEHKTSSIDDLSLAPGGLTRAEYLERRHEYGENRIVLHYPNYVHILQDSVLSPYFAFQIFTSVLYAVDNFAMYSIFNIIMLVFVEGANVFEKYSAEKQTCKLAPEPCKVRVRRDGEEEIISSDQLVPGDVVVMEKEDYDIFTEPKKEVMTRQQKVANTMANSLPFLKLFTKFEEMLFGKYYDLTILNHLSKIAFSQLFPVDMVVLEGQLIADEQVLTGEQTSQIKEAVDAEQIADRTEILQENIVYGGTSLIQCQTAQVVLQVVKIAEQTEQGKLIRQIAFNEERMNVTTRDSLVFLGIMCVVALLSAAYCFARGFRSRIATLSRLSLETLMVFVNSIPPDLPTQLSMCISNSVREIRKKKIFSTEPYRILNAGRLQYICFDKSGTLTQSNIKILGVDDQLSSESVKRLLEMVKKQQELIKVSDKAELIIAANESITRIQDKYFGDLLEVNSFKAAQCQFADVNNVSCKGGQKIRILKRFYFNSTLKRMSVFCECGGREYVVCKGGPEILRGLLAEVPKFYDRTVEEYVRRGLRVLALGWKEQRFDPNATREDVERDFEFAGLLVCQTPLKTDTFNAVKMLSDADHKLKVISGDHVLNVAVTAEECGIIGGNQEIYVITEIEDEMYCCQNLRAKDQLKLPLEDILASGHAFCAANNFPCFERIIGSPELVKKISVFARATPEQKKQIIRQLKQNGQKVGYVGDGCNDLNALQESDVGIALMEELPKEVVVKQERENIPYPSYMLPDGALPDYESLLVEAERRANQRRTNYQNEFRTLVFEQQNYKRYLKLQKEKEKQGILEMWSDVLDQEEDQSDIKMGDATIAAHFTVKSGSLSGVLDIIRQGRCALATVQMNFKTTALNCIIAAYSMTVLTLSGVRSSDYQLIAESMLSMVILMNIDKVKEAHEISKKRPPTRIVGPYLLASTFGQALVHISALFAGMTLSHYSHETVKFSAKFEPSEMNSVIFYIRMVQDVCVTLVNFPGRPHMQSILEHKMVLIGIAVYALGIWLMMTQQIPDLNATLKLVDLPISKRGQIASICIFDVVGCWFVEVVSKKLFGE